MFRVSCQPLLRRFTTEALLSLQLKSATQKSIQSERMGLRGSATAYAFRHVDRCKISLLRSLHSAITSIPRPSRLSENSVQCAGLNASSRLRDYRRHMSCLRRKTLRMPHLKLNTCNNNYARSAELFNDASLSNGILTATQRVTEDQFSCCIFQTVILGFVFRNCLVS
jgi:hypothetical protein